MSNFMEKCRRAEVTCDDIDDFIDEWHASPRGKSLHDFLGMTRQEYALWVADSSILPTIVSTRSHYRSIDDLLEEFAAQLPAPTQATGELSAQELINWLKGRRAFIGASKDG